MLCVSLPPPRQETHRFSIDTVQRKCVRQFLGKQCSFRLCTVTLMRGFRLGGFLKPKLPTDGRKYVCFVCAACERSTSLVAVVVSYRLSLVLVCLYSVATIPLRCFASAERNPFTGVLLLVSEAALPPDTKSGQNDVVIKCLHTFLFFFFFPTQPTPDLTHAD